ncbi:DUF4139 domain-containing protein [uncultured Jannaschia sp.]|uniref:DUF4139 domain-containing protein n=1 Tax=uncultured Jannaschia sp. TaxID=293347 RepID=UPI0026025EDD|nr:DUF4139 domain-containing protein [uncultured Jannaschia sp.]
MRLIALLILLPGLALADELRLPAPVTDATFYSNGVTLTRRDGAELSAGTHRLLIPMAGRSGTVPDIELDGARLVAQGTAPGGLVDGRAVFDEAQAAAFAAWEAAQYALDRARDAADRAQAAAEAASAQIAFWRSVSGEALTGLDPAALTATASAVADGVARAQTAQIEARAAVRAANEAVDEAGRDVAQARTDLEATGARLDPVDLLVLDITVSEAGPVALALRQDAFGGWRPLYDAILDEDAGRLSIVRRAEMRQDSGLPLRGVSVRLSTADPTGQADPAPVFPDRAILTQKEVLREEMVESRSIAMAPAPMADAASEGIMAVAVDGMPVLTYAVPVPVDLPPTETSVTVTLGTLDLPVRVFNRASPRRDAFAFLMAEAADGPSETLLPGAVTRYRGATRVGEGALPLVPAGDMFEIAFGPRRDLPLEFTVLDNATGERGIFSSSGTRVQDIAFRVRNLSDAAEVVETLYALPYSEEEALDLTVRATPAPDARDVDDARGVSRWDLEIAPGGEAEVRIRVEATWPEGQVLDWRP